MTTAAITVMSVSIGCILSAFGFCLFKVMTAPADTSSDED